jgi:hypothetical protein
MLKTESAPLSSGDEDHGDSTSEQSFKPDGHRASAKLSFRVAPRDR